MSYILDALKKSQRQREMGSVPRLTTEQVPLHRAGSAVIPWVVAGVALVAAGALVALYGPFGRQVAPDKPAEIVVNLPIGPDGIIPPVSLTPAGATVSPSVAPASINPQAYPAPAAVTGSVALPVVDLATEQGGHPIAPAAMEGAGVMDGSGMDPTGAGARGSGLALPGSGVAPNHAGGASTSAEEDGTPAGMGSQVGGQNETPGAGMQAAAVPPAVSAGGETSQSWPLLSELPLDVQQSFPPLSLNVHVYSPAPKERFVFLNMQKYKEGERLREGVLIEEITPEGAVLRYGQQRFRLLY